MKPRTTTMVVTPVAPVPVYPQVYPNPYNANMAYPNILVWFLLFLIESLFLEK